LACERYGKLDVLVGNAGVMPISPLDDLRVEDWEEMIDVNIKGVLYGIAAALPVFRKQGSGHFVNIASTAGHLVRSNMSVYAGTKFAVRAISEGLRQEAGDKLRVTIISPGFTRTNFAETVNNPEVKAQLAASRDKFAMPPVASPGPLGSPCNLPTNSAIPPSRSTQPTPATRPPTSTLTVATKPSASPCSHTTAPAALTPTAKASSPGNVNERWRDESHLVDQYLRVFAVDLVVPWSRFHGMLGSIARQAS
jgi:NAD(P)-dependent dehydrogenase (short-subunit alcohol dehydrogenase family)